MIQLAFGRIAVGLGRANKSNTESCWIKKDLNLESCIKNSQYDKSVTHFNFKVRIKSLVVQDTVFLKQMYLEEH